MASWNKALNVRPPISKLYYYHKHSGTSEMLVTSEGKLQRVSGTSLTPITGTLTSENVRFLPYKDRSINDAVLLADGGKLKVYKGGSVSEVTPHVPTDGTGGTPLETTDPGLNDLANLTNFRTFAIKKDRIFAAAHPTVKNRVSFCYFDPYLGYAVYDYWPAIYFFDVAVEDNDEIIELRVFRNTLIILCKRSVWVLKGDGATIADYELTKVNVPNGCISPSSVCEVGNNLFYLADDQIYSLFATEQEFISAQMVSGVIQPILKGIGLADKALANAIFYDNKYYLSFPSGLTLVYDITLECWTKFTNVKANGFAVVDNELYFCSGDGYIYRFDENKFSDDGTPISFTMQTKIMDFGLPVQIKKLRRLWLLQKQFGSYKSLLSAKISLDQSTFIELDDLVPTDGKGLMWGESLWGKSRWGFSEITQHEIKVRQKGKSVQVEISNDNVDEPMTVFGLAFEYQVKKP